MTKEDLLFEIDYQMKELKNVIDEMISLMSVINHKTPNPWEKTALSSYCSQYYNGIENILKRFFKYFNRPLPKTSSWHIELFDLFCKQSENNSYILFSDDLKPNFMALLRLRHFILHNYSNFIEWERLKIACEEIPDIHIQFTQRLYEYLKLIK